MDAVTYSDSRTVEFINRFMIPCRANTQSFGNLAGSYGIQYTPTVLTLDGDGREHNRTEGFLDAKEFIPSLMLGVGKTDFSNKLVKRAIAMIDMLLIEYPMSRVVSDATRLKQEWLKQQTGK